jgi:hypothetical protein
VDEVVPTEEAMSSDDDSDADDAAERGPDSLDVATFADEIARIADSQVTMFGQQKLFKDVMNVPLSDIARAVADVSTVRSNVYLSAEQSNKTMTAAGVMTVAHVMRRPVVMFVMDLKRSIEALCTTKIEAVLRHMGVEARNVSGAGFRQLASSAADMEKFRSGALALVVQPLQNNIALLYDEVVRRHDVRDIIFILDESDAMWSSFVAQKRIEDKVTAREHQMYRLLTSAGGGGQRRMFSSRVRCMFSISATHMSTLEWHSMWRVPYRATVVDLDLLRSRGYAVYDCLSVLKSSDGAELYLEPGKQTRAHDYNIHSSSVSRMLEVFAADADSQTKTGLMMMVAMSPRINADGMNAHIIAGQLLRRLHDIRSHDPDNKAAVAVVVCTDGPWLVQLSAGGEVVRHKLRFSSMASGRSVLRNMTPSEALEYIDTHFGLDAPALLLGYQCLRRGISLRSQRRAVTHLMVGPTRGMATANVQQMTMRCGGFTVHVRLRNGFSDVTVLMLEADLAIVRNLYAFTADALRVSATGRIEDVDAWKSNAYAPHFAGVLQASRAHASGRLGQHVRTSLSDATLLADSDDEESDEDEVEEESDEDEAVDISGGLARAALKAFHRVYVENGRRATAVTYKMLERAGFASRRDKNCTIVTRLFKEHKLLSCVKSAVYKLTPRGVATICNMF